MLRTMEDDLNTIGDNLDMIEGNKKIPQVCRMDGLDRATCALNVPTSPTLQEALSKPSILQTWIFYLVGDLGLGHLHTNFHLPGTPGNVCRKGWKFPEIPGNLQRLVYKFFGSVEFFFVSSHVFWIPRQISWTY